MSPLKDQIRRYFTYLFDKHGFSFIELENDYGGNIAVAQSCSLRIRFIQDRSDFFLDIGDMKGPEKWTGFYKILDQLRANGKMNGEYKYSNHINAISKLLNQNFPAIYEFFQNNEKVREIIAG